MSGGRGDERSGDELPEQAVLIEIPDDARELDGDVAAYHRELRIARRRAQAHRLRRYGITSPVVVGLLAMAVAVTALFVALRPDRTGAPGAAPLATAPAAAVGAVGGLIPDEPVLVGDVTRSAQSLRPGVLALVPEHCGCLSVIENLARQAGQFGLKLYVVAPTGVDSEVDEITSKVHGGHAKPVFDPVGALARTYHATGVTAVLLRSDGVVDGVERDVATTTRLGTRLAHLDRRTG